MTLARFFFLIGIVFGFLSTANAVNYAYCTSQTDGDVKPGWYCQDSRDCFGSSTCENKRCAPIAAGVIKPGGYCQDSRDCFGSSTCENNHCASVLSGDIEPGGYCQDSTDCSGNSNCR